MSVTVFGSCRVQLVKYNNNIHDYTTYTHSTKEVIQLIHFLKNDLSIPAPYNILCFRTGIVNRSPVMLSSRDIHSFNSSNEVVMEICSRKKYIHNDYQLHHLAVDKRFNLYHATPVDILNGFTLETQSDSEIENDILEIQKLIYPKRLMIVSHYDALSNGTVIPSRHKLIALLENLCHKYSITFINPTVVFKDYPQARVLTDDLGHYTEFGRNLLACHIDSCVETLISHE